MLCPEVWNFPAPKIITSTKVNHDLLSTQKIIQMNSFYKSIIIAIPDELRAPSEIEEIVTKDSEFYKLTECPIDLFLNVNFIQNFVKSGRLYCVTVEKDCSKDVCACFTPDGYLLLHISEPIYQCLGLQGTKQSNNFYMIKINLNAEAILKKAKDSVCKLGKFNFYAIWEPCDENICPSSLAKYFHDQNVKVTVINQQLNRLTPTVATIPSADVEPSELVEWLGMLGLGGDMTPEHDYVSLYSIPESNNPLDSSRMSLTIIKGFFSEQTVNKLCQSVSNYVVSRDLENYWCSVSFQGCSDSLWRFSISTPNCFQSHDTTTTVIFNKGSNTVYSAGLVMLT